MNSRKDGLNQRHVDGMNQPLTARGAGGDQLNPVGKDDIPFRKLIKHHLFDWGVVVVVAICEILTYVVWQPFNRFISIEKINDYKYPKKSYTVPTWSVLCIAVVIPLLVFFIEYLRKRKIRDFHNAFLGLGLGIALTALCTDTIKNSVGMPRPNFYWTCFPDGMVRNGTDGGVLCSGAKSDLRDGYKSFPSGHASWCYAGLGYLSFYLAGKLRIFDKRGNASRVVFVVLPLLAATIISITRVQDYQHRWVDIIFGGIVGFVLAYFMYRQHFPSLFSEQAGYPYLYIPGSGSHITTNRQIEIAAANSQNAQSHEPDLEAART